MMSKGFYLRGGISFGSYYSDKHMIFSGALVKAYELESEKSKNPIITVDLELLERLKNKISQSNVSKEISRSIIFESSKPELVFLNPLSSIDEAYGNIDQIENGFKEVMSEFDQDDEMNE
jgi:hypothetical protein